jgi:hypothetical protein
MSSLVSPAIIAAILWFQRYAARISLMGGCGLPVVGTSSHDKDPSMAHSPPYLHPFVCFICRRSFRRRGSDRDFASCPVCGKRAIRLNRKFRPPRRDDLRQWAKVETLVELGFRFDTLYDADGAVIRYPSSQRGIPSFVKKVAQVAEDRSAKTAKSKAATALRRRQRQAARQRQGK